MAVETATRKVLMSVELMEQICTRDANGFRLHVEWGEPDADGWYTPSVTRDETDCCHPLPIPSDPRMPT